MAGRFGITAREANAIALEDACLGLRKNGHSYEEIAVRLNTSVKNVGTAINRAMRRFKKETAESCDFLVTLEEMRLDDMFRVLVNAINAGHLESIALGLKIMERRAKLRGLDAPTKTATVPAENGPKLDHLPTDKLLAIAALLEQAPAEFDEEAFDPGYLEGASLPEEREAAGPSAIAPAPPGSSKRVGDPLNEEL